MLLLELQRRGDVARVVEGAQGGDGGVRGQVGEVGDRRQRGAGDGLAAARSTPRETVAAAPPSVVRAGVFAARVTWAASRCSGDA